MSDTVIYSVTDGVATILLSRPQVMNALDAKMLRGLRTATERAEQDAAARVVVIRGAGPAFLAGGDVALFHANLSRMPELVKEGAAEFHRAILALRRVPKPVLASVHGAVAGAGVSLAAAADLCIAAEGTKFTMAYSRLGTSPDGGATHTLPRLLGHRKALELILLSDAFDAQAALEMGLVNRVVPDAQLGAETEALAQRLATGPTAAYGEIKRLIYAGQDRTFAEQLEAEAGAFTRCAGTRDFAEGVTAFVEKRKPIFKGE